MNTDVTTPRSAVPHGTVCRQVVESPPPVRWSATVGVQTRKIVTTSAASWLVLALGLALVGVVAARAVLSDVSVQTAYATSGVIVSTLLPAIAAVTMASEFGSSMTASTFTLEPRRGRVVGAQLVPLVGLAVASSVLALVVAVGAVAAAAAARGSAFVWDLSPATFLGSTLIVVLLTLAGAAVGLLLLNVPLALVILLPSAMFWSTVAMVSATGAKLRAWLDLGSAAAPLSDLGTRGPETLQLARLGVAVLVSIVLPFVLGSLRTARREVK